MKKLTKILTFLLIGAMILSFSACGGDDKKTDEPPKEFPEAMEQTRTDAMTFARDYAKRLEGSWVDQEQLLVSSAAADTATESDSYVNLKSTLASFVTESGALRMYVLVPNEEKEYCITVDSSETPAPWFTSMGKKTEYRDAYEAGLVSSGRKGVNENGTCGWFAYSPLYNSEGFIAAVLCVEVAAPALAEYPDWIETSETEE